MSSNQLREQPSPGRHLLRGYLAVVGGYVVVASLWVVASDSLLDAGLLGALRFSDSLQTLKGLGFVLVSAGGLYWLMWRDDRRVRAVEADRTHSDERFGLIFDSLTDQAILMLAPDGRVIDCNRGTAHVLGWQPEELIGSDASGMYREDDPARAVLDQLLAEAAQAGRAEQNLWHRRKDGSRFWASVAVSRLVDRAGHLSGFAKVTRDITERRHAEEVLHANEERLRESERRTRLMMDSSVDGIITIDERGIIESFSGAASRIFGYAAEDVIGHNVTVLMPESERGKHDGYLRRYLETGKKKVIGLGTEVEALRQDGTTFPMDLAVSEVFFGRDHRLFVGTVRDLTERRAIEAQLRQAQKMESIGHLTGGLAHDFNNLLSVTLGCAEMLQEDLAHDAKGSKLSAAIIEAARRGADLTGRLLAISRRQALQPVSVDLGRLLIGLHDLFSRTLGEEIEIHLTLPKGLPNAIADRAQIENAVLNLAINARDAMPDGGTLTISVERARLDDDYAHRNPGVTAGDYVVVVVSDTGIGMAKDVADHAFDPFFTTKPIGKGTGLGLSMVYGFAKQSGGHVKIYSEPGIGTTVRLYLPQAADDAHPPREAGTRESSQAPTGVETILLAEDDSLVRRYAADQLVGLGYDVVATADGPAALAEIASGRKIDVLFTDVVMSGGMNGRELADLALRHRPGLKVLFTTGYTEDVMVLQGKLAPGMQILNKPYGHIALARKLRAVIDG